MEFPLNTVNTQQVSLHSTLCEQKLHLPVLSNVEICRSDFDLHECELDTSPLWYCILLSALLLSRTSTSDDKFFDLPWDGK